MFRIMLVYGAIAGAIIIAVGIAKMVLMNGMESELFGYLTMIVALSMIFVGIKRYRDDRLGGVIKFFPALWMGIGIAAVAGVIYTLSWEVSLHLTDFAFVDQYREMMISEYEGQGVTPDELSAKIENLESMMEMYENPLFRMAVSYFLEILPVGLIVALISAALLRNPKVFPAKA